MAVFDLSQFSGSINVQAGGIALFPKKSWVMLQNMHALQASHMVEVDCTIIIDLQNLSQVGSGMVFFFLALMG